MDKYNILEKEEGKTIEFKRDLSSSKPIIKTLIAFANTAGGILVIGIDDDKKIIGVENPLQEEENLCNIIADSVSPRLVPNIEMMNVDGKILLIVEVFLSAMRPHWLKTKDIYNGTYARLGSTNRVADKELIAELQRTVQGKTFDEQPMIDLTVDDLDLKELNKNFDRDKELKTEELLSLKILSLYQGKLVPTIGAILMFGKKRQFHFSDAWIQCGRFIGVDKAEILDHIDISDHLPTV